MRYIITLNGRQVGEERSRSAAEVQYADHRDGQAEGTTLTLTDTRKHEVLYENYQTTAAEREQQASAACERALARYAESATERLTKFQEAVYTAIAQVEADPTYEFRWADNAFEAAARLYAVRRARGLRASLAWIEVAASLRETGVRELRHGGQSTSTSHNLTAYATIKALLDVADVLDGCVRTYSR